MSKSPALVRVTITADLPEHIWGAGECLDMHGAAGVIELIKDDLHSLMPVAEWKIERIGRD